jgi:alpha-glucosidase
MAQGVDGVWNDMNEPAIGDGPEVSMPKDNIHRGGEGMAQGPHLRFHNVYGFNMVRASRDGLLLANPNKRPFVLSRSNFLGGHRYAATWTGDNYSSWEQFEASVPMSLTLGLSGQPFNGPDIGGFVSSTHANLLAHWTALGVYFPFVRNHTTENSVAQEPWAFDKNTLDICRTAINRRYRLMPYIYTLFEEASVNGMPVMRPAFMLDAKNPAFRTEEKAFMLGGDLYIIPRWAPEVAVPEGNWNILKLEDEDDGVQPYLAQRPGSIIPMANLYQNTTELRTDSLTLLVNPDAEGKATGVLYEDARDGFEYRDGQFARYELKAETVGKQITVSIQKVGGKQDVQPRMLRIGYVTDNKVTYSPWISGESVSMKVVKDKTNTLDLKKLTFVTIEKK